MDFFGGESGSFKFDFLSSSPAEEANQTPVADTESAVPLPALEISSEDNEIVPQDEIEVVSIVDDIKLFKRKPRNAGVVMEDQTISPSDLIPGKYEGGLKLWECAVDLTRHLHEALEAGSLNLQGARVLELGCGHALPGIFCLLKGASEVVLQDYNLEVLTELTRPNVTANTTAQPNPFGASPGSADKGVGGRVRYLAGDWSLLSADLLPTPGAFDLILTADTIYSIPSLPKLHQLIKHCLNPKGGVALVAAKSHYFGVGGSTRAFEQVVTEEGSLKVEQVKSYADGCSNVREILKLTWQ